MQFCHVARGTQADPFVVPTGDDLYANPSLGCWKRVMEEENQKFVREATNESINGARLHD